MRKKCTLLIFLILCLTTLKGQVLIDSVKESFENVTQLNVKGAFCKVDILAGTDNVVEFEGQIRAVRRHEDIKIRYEQKGNVLSVWIDKPDNLPAQTKGFLAFTVPSSIKLQVETISGNIVTKDAGTSTVELKSLSGAISAENINGNLRVSTVSGGINAARIIGNVESKTLSGSTSIEEVQGELNVNSVSGKVKASSVLNGVIVKNTSGSVTADQVIGSIDVKTVSGAINLQSIRGDINATSSSGSISLDGVVGGLYLKSVSGRISGNDLVLTSNSQFHNTSGNIDLTLGTDLNMLSFNLTTTSGSLTVGNTRATRNLVVGDGEIVVTSRTTSGNQRFR
ncbi:DUF4097 family beta strand repeat-containing protein [Alkalitalea saponilacus]|uniref:Putative adhesin n=1 Tax=Alkalitalea saponilacus TaxID=889453 RepID=A0A1T5A0W6_9BACT|nr:DUF4097 family beta strand repeat-containing protein [Alkalitalea saponilacus]ASB48916.1 hypothetical protein CDL62_07085 [Alkalitalea saponilacus]SKB28684.1 Putative adhesin [Alkalitalea saponilacus]